MPNNYVFGEKKLEARKIAGERSTPDLKPVRKDTRSPKQEQSVAPQTGPWSNKKFKKNKQKNNNNQLFSHLHEWNELSLYVSFHFEWVAVFYAWLRRNYVICP